MNRWSVFFAGVLVSCALINPLHAAAPAAPNALQIEKMAVGTAVDNRELQGETKDIDASVTRVYCWMKVSASPVPVTLKQVWYADGKKEAEVPLEIKSESARTWSSKSVWPGSWKVDATTDSGQVLSSTEFTVKGAAK